MTPTRERIRIVLADDHAVVRDGVRQLLEAQGDLDVVGEAADGAEAVRLAGTTDPDVVLLDLSMPGPGGTAAIEAIQRHAPRTRVLVVTMHEEDAYVRAALDAGASGFVGKHVDGAALVAAIREVQRGRIVVNVARPPGSPAGAPGASSTPSAPLSVRERQVLKLLAQGHSNRAAAEWLGLSVKTIETYRSRMGSKLGLRTRAELFRYAVESGLLGADDTTPSPDTSH